MTMVSAISNGRGDATVDALYAEFGAVLAHRIVESEMMDFLWDSRLKEHYLGQYLDFDWAVGDESPELSRVAILSFLDSGWHVGICLVDGEGSAVDLLWKSRFGGRDEA